MAKEAIIAKLQEECQNKDQSIDHVMTRQEEIFETCEKKIKEKIQALKRAEKALEFERGQRAKLE